jgi:hypothetical protein
MKDLASTLNRVIALFSGLTPKQMQGFLRACEMKTYRPGEVLCEYGARSDRLFVLVRGQLVVLSEEGELLAKVRPVSTVGEIGFITRRPRSATVRTEGRSQILSIDYGSFKKLADKDFRFQSRIYRNTIRLLAVRLSDANDLIVRYRKLSREKQKPGAPPAIPPQEAQAPPPQESREQQEAAEAERIVLSFYRLVGQEPSPQQLGKDRALYRELRDAGHSAEDVVYAIKWTTRNIPAAKRFNMVKLSIKEAFEDRWST